MKRITVTISEEQAARLARTSRMRGVPVSALIRDLLDEAGREKMSPFEAMIGIVSKKLPYCAADIDAELEKSWAESIRADRG